MVMRSGSSSGRAVGNQIANSVIQKFERHGDVVPISMMRKLFTVGVVDNIDHNPSAITVSDSFQENAAHQDQKVLPWASYHALYRSENRIRTSIIRLMPHIYKNSHSNALVKHSTEEVKADTPVLAMDQPLHALTKAIQWNWPASPQHGDLRLSGPLSGQGASGGAQSRDRTVPADVRADSLATEPPTPRTFREARESSDKPTPAEQICSVFKRTTMVLVS
ncbi:hypothetical protein PoB_002067200 [Plakobranchus ocellatus]|uniref:Uncharacterized protein n=1 Tax=Plakobranchus ocellatus TaxID=259542 RepID=A0AAV3ZI30_9GAST|nr:hypothetical protein PoB_002067200 [Plakobranchus ocellatus]